MGPAAAARPPTEGESHADADATQAAPPPAALSWAEVCEALGGGPVREASGAAAQDSGTNLPVAGICRLYRAIFCVRQAAPSQAAAISVLVGAMEAQAPTLATGQSAGGGEPPIALHAPLFSSVLFRHECCYLVGQLGADCVDDAGRKQAFSCLSAVLLDEAEDEVTRHEAAEGIAAVHKEGVTGRLGGLSEDGVLRDLEMLSTRNGGVGPLAETCYLAVEGIRQKGATRVCACQYASHDPAIGDPSATAADIPRLSELLASGEAELFERYVAMFTLRNLGAADALARTLDADCSSCVLRHELAFVLGQMEHEVAVGALVGNLGKAGEHAMVRHEAAIALGSIGGETAKEALGRFADDPEPMVAESCQVALATAAYWEAWEQLEQRLGCS